MIFPTQFEALLVTLMTEEATIHKRNTEDEIFEAFQVLRKEYDVSETTQLKAYEFLCEDDIKLLTFTFYTIMCRHRP